MVCWRTLTSYPPRLPLARQLTISFVLGSLVLLLSACATSPAGRQQLAELPPLKLDDGELATSEVEALAPTPDLLAVDDDMREFVARYTEGAHGRRERLLMLHRAVSGRATLGIDYDPYAEGTAVEAFHSQEANCLSYANMFVAMGREAGLDIRYQWLEIRPQWTRLGERVAVRLHVNAVVHLNARDRFMVDIDPLPSRDIAGSQEISDTDASALYHNNVAMDALAREDVKTAWVHAVRALQLSPDMPHLWVNLGAVYRRADQHRAAESAYLLALELDSMERSAMNNLMVLYDLEGREEERNYWAGRVEVYRDRNPYYHAWLGDQAAEEGDMREALGHYMQALELQPEDAYLHYSTGIIYEQLHQPKAALRYIQQALDLATLRRDFDRYQLKYDELNRAQMAVY